MTRASRLGSRRGGRLLRRESVAPSRISGPRAVDPLATLAATRSRCTQQAARPRHNSRRCAVNSPPLSERLDAGASERRRRRRSRRSPRRDLSATIAHVGVGSPDAVLTTRTAACVKSVWPAVVRCLNEGHEVAHLDRLVDDARRARRQSASPVSRTPST